MREIVRGYTTYYLEEGLASQSLDSMIAAGEAIAEAVVGVPQLQNIFNTPDIDKRLIKGIVKDIVAKKFTADSASLLSFMAAAEQQSQFVAVVTQLIVEIDTLLKMTNSSGREPSTSLSPDRLAALYLDVFQQYTSYRQARDLIAGYMEPIFEAVTTTSDLKILEDSLFEVANLIKENKDLARVLGDSYVSGEVKSSIVFSLFASKLNQVAYRVLRFSVSIPRVRDVASLISFCGELIVTERGKRLAEVRSVVELSLEERTRLQTILEHLVERKVEMRFVTDLSLMGGFVVFLGDYLIDASLLTKLTQLSENLLLSA